MIEVAPGTLNVSSRANKDVKLGIAWVLSQKHENHKDAVLEEEAALRHIIQIDRKTAHSTLSKNCLSVC